jgi:Sulfatase
MNLLPGAIMHRTLRLIAVFFCLLLVVLAHAQTSGSLISGPSFNPSGQTGGGNKQRPNILFIIMDDVGIDQMQIFGYGGVTPPSTPNINAIARAGVRFRNVWSMPECSPSRAIYFEGRYPLRTNVNNAILSNDLANSQVSPFEVTTPQILRTKNYKSALFGKFHLAGPDNNEFTYSTPHVLGWDYFDGFLEGAMHPIDTTIGNQYTTPANTEPIYSCGFIPNRANDPMNGADLGACVQPDKSCTQLTKSANMQNPGFSCVQQGGIFVKEKSCAAAKNLDLGFANPNGYYVWGRVINKQDGTVVQYPFTAPSARGYVSDATTSAAVDWIKQQNAKKSSWMTTVSYSNVHTPYQQPPENLLPGSTVDTAGLKCTGNSPANVVATRILSNRMIEAMDTEIGNLMVSAGLARRLGNGTIDYRPEETNTMVIIIGDNGTYAPGVKAPFDLNRAKGYVYQTGVWVPLIVAGPLVDSPDREVKSMISITDLFQLFGEIAGADVRKAVAFVACFGFAADAGLSDAPESAEHSHHKLYADGEQHSSHDSASLRRCALDSADVPTAVERPRALPLRRRCLVWSHSR